MLALLAKLSQTHFYWMLDTRTELFSHVQIFKDKVSRRSQDPISAFSRWRDSFGCIDWWHIGVVVWSHTQSDRNTFWDLQVCRLQSFQCSTSKGANWDGSGIWPGHHLCFGHVQLEGDSWAHKGHAIEMMSLSWLTNIFDSHQLGWRSLSRCVKVHDALIILHNKQDSPCVKAMRPLLLLSSTLIVWWNLPQTPGRLCKWLILTFRLFSKALSSVSGAYWLPSHSNWSRWRVQVALVQMAHYLQHIALTAAAASFTQTVSMWLSPADLNLLIKTQWAHFKSSSLRSRSAAGHKREVLKWC